MKNGTLRKLLAMLVALGVLLSMAPTALMEVGDDPIEEIIFEEIPEDSTEDAYVEDTEDADEEYVLVEQDSPSQEEIWTDFESSEAPSEAVEEDGSGDDGAPSPADAGALAALSYARIAEAVTLGDADGARWTLEAGFVALVLEARPDDARIAFATADGVREENVPLAALCPMTAEETDAFMDALFLSDGVTAYQDDPDYPLMFAAAVQAPDAPSDDIPVEEESTGTEEDPEAEKDPETEDPEAEKDPEAEQPNAESDPDSEGEPEDPADPDAGSDDEESAEGQEASEDAEDEGEDADGNADEAEDETEGEEEDDADALVVTSDEEDGEEAIEAPVETDALELDEIAAEAPALAEEPLADGEEVYALDTYEETVFLDDDYDNEAMFAEYANGIFYSERREALYSTKAREKLSGYNCTIYDILKAEISNIALGKRTSSAISISAGRILPKSNYTASELGVRPSFDSNGKLTASTVSAMSDAFHYRILPLTDICSAIYFDCPFEFYWIDLVRYQRPTIYWPSALIHSNPSNGSCWLAIDLSSSMTFSYSVMEEYRLNGSNTQVNPARVNSAINAANNAKAIVRKYADYSDYAKLYAYAAEIGYRTDYNTPASRDNWNYSNQQPWQLIWVFDDNLSNQVVCRGYAVAFQYLCDLSTFSDGTRSWVVNGYVEHDTSRGHAWNIIRMDDGQNYVIDPTWMDGDEPFSRPDSNILNWINNEKGGLFLVGASGSVNGGYSLYYRTTSQTTWRAYYNETLRAYSTSDLTLSSNRKYVPHGFMKIGGKTYYFNNGKYITNSTVTIGGKQYKFGSNGAMTSWRTGSQNVNGKSVYFDSNGLHVTHSLAKDMGTAATCTRSGKTTGYHCTVCGKVTTRQTTIPARGHSATTLRGYAATCTSPGRTNGSKCASCGMILTAQRTIPARGHSPVTVRGGVGYTNGTKCASCGVWLSAPQPTLRTINVPRLGRNGTVTVSLGESLFINPSFAPARGLTVKRYTYRTGMLSFSSVNGSTVVTALREGKVKLKIFTNKKRKKATVTLRIVNPNKPSRVRIAPYGTVTLRVGQTTQLAAALTPTSARTTLSWRSSKSRVATVDGNGVVHALKKGKTRITVRTANRKKSTITVKVVN